MRRAYGISVCLLLLGAELPLAAQIGYPGQYPPGGQYPGGGYPPGRYPPGTGTGPGIPMPRRGKKTTKQEKDNPVPTKELEGLLRKMDDKLIVLEASDKRIISVKRNEKTKFLKDDEAMKPADLKPGDHLRVEATEDEQGFFFAVNVNFEKAGTAEERLNASQPVEVIMTSPSDGDGDDRPVLRRSGSANESSSNDDPDRPVLHRKDPPAETAKAEPPQPQKPAPAAKPDDPDRPVLHRKDPPAETAKAEPPQPQNKPAPAAKPVAPEPDSDVPPPVDQILNQPKPAPAPRDADDPGPPKLARGRPVRRAAAPDPPPGRNPEPVQIASAPIPVTNREPETETRPPQQRAPEANEHHDPVIEKTRERAGEFTETLPNYVCQEFMARFANMSHTVNWQAQDVVSMEVIYENGKESYRNLAINNKPVKKGMEQLGGSWSTGEFGTVLLDLFHPSTAADFRYRRESVASGKTSLVYDFDVQQPNSHWNIVAAAQSYKPAYRGTVWIDKRTYRVLRIEMQAYHFPEDFPFDKVESATEYDYVRFGGEKTFLMPVHAETLMCQHGTNQCSMNKIDFRNYHKYSGESVITFGDDKDTKDSKDGKKK